MRKELPVRPNLEHLKSQAKDLLEAFQRKDPEALRRFRGALPAAHGADDTHLAAMNLALHDAQSVVAREYGFASFAELRARVEELEKAQPTPALLGALMDPHLTSPLPLEVQRALLAAMSDTNRGKPDEVPVAATLPLLPVRNALLAVGAVAPLNIGRATTIAAIEAAREGGGTVAVFAQKDDANESPTEGHLHRVGSAARLLAVIPTDDRGTWIVVRAAQWIELERIETRQPYLVARVRRFVVHGQETAQVKLLHETLRDRVRAFAAKLPNPEHLLQLTERMTALELADVTLANLSCSVDEKARCACEPSLAARLECVLALIDRAA